LSLRLREVRALSPSSPAIDVSWLLLADRDVRLGHHLFNPDTLVNCSKPRSSLWTWPRFEVFPAAVLLATVPDAACTRAKDRACPAPLPCVVRLRAAPCAAGARLCGRAAAIDVAC
jgi:hypothetical protein